MAAAKSFSTTRTLSESPTMSSDIRTRILSDPILHYPSATVACFDPTTGNLPRRQLDDARLLAYLGKLADGGAEAVLLGASTGQGHLRTVDELAHWFEVAAQAQRLVKMALLRPEDGMEANRRLIDLLAAHDFPVVFVRPGTDLAPNATPEEVAANVQPLVAALAEAELAVGVYSISDVSGVPLKAEAAERLLDGPGGDKIVAAKVTEADYLASTREFLVSPALSRLKIVQGWDPHIAQALAEGSNYDVEARQRVGVTSGPMAFALKQFVHLLEAAKNHDWDEVQAAQGAVNRLFEAMQDDPRKFADLQRAKVIMGLGQPLLAEVTPEQIERVLAALENLPRPADRARLAASLDLMGDGPYHDRLLELGSR